jgi:hypothetical protein
MSFEVLKAVGIKSALMWDVKPFSSQLFWPEGTGSKFISNAIYQITRRHVS